MVGIGPEVGLKFESTVEEKTVESPVRLAVSCTCWIVAARLAYKLVPSVIILVFGWLVMQTAKKHDGLVAVDCVLLRASRSLAAGKIRRLCWPLV